MEETPLPKQHAPDSLSEKAGFVAKMEPALKRATALLGGTDAMRAAGEEYLPRFPGEHEDTHRWRLKSAVLNNVYDAMAGQMVGMMTQKKATWVKKSRIDPAILANLDKRGNDVDGIVPELIRALLTKGRPHVLVDQPPRPPEAKTRADDLALGLRPYWVMLEPTCVFNAWADTSNGDERLGDIRWREFTTRRAADGFGLVQIERIRVLKLNDLGAWFQRWEREREQDPFTLEEEGQLISDGDRPLAEIPLVTGYADRQSFMVARPTLDDIAHKNIEHWQSSADQRHILTVTRFPILYQIGVQNAVPLIGPYSMFQTSTPKTEAEIGYAEAEGKGMEHGWKDLDRIIQEIETMGLRIVVSDAAKTDAGEKVDFSKEGSRLQRVAKETERVINQALIYTARWLNQPDADAGQIELDKEFGLSSDDAKAIEQLIQLREAGDLSRPTLWAEVTERRLFRTKFNPQKEQALLEEEEQGELDRQMALGGPPNQNDASTDEDTPPPDEEDDDTGGGGGGA